MSFEESFRAMLREELRAVLADRPAAQGLDDFISYQEAAEETGRCKRTISNWVREGKVASYGEGHKKAVKRSELRAYLESTRRFVAPPASRAQEIVEGLAPRGAKGVSR